MASPNPVAYQNKMRASLARAKNSARSDASAGGRKPDEAPSKKSGSGAKGVGADLKRAQNLILNRPDKSKSRLAQAAGSVGSVAGGSFFGFVGSFLPVVGTVVGKVIGSRLGRLFGENPILGTLIILVFVILLAVILLIFLSVPIAAILLLSQKLEQAARIGSWAKMLLGPAFW